MKKELYQMLEMIVKTANRTAEFVNVRKNPSATEETIIEATDSKRALQIILKSESIAEGQYKIAKTGKEYTLIPIPEEKRERFPDTDRVFYKDEAVTFRRSISTHAHDATMAEILAYFGVMQEILTPGKQENGINIIRPIFLDTLKPWVSIIEPITLEMKGTTPNYPIQLESFTATVKIRFVVMPFLS